MNTEKRYEEPIAQPDDESLENVSGGYRRYSHIVESEEQCFNECGNMDNGTRFCYGYNCPVANMVGKACDRYDYGI